LSLDHASISLEERDATTIPCACCGTATRRVTRDLRDRDGWLAYYSVDHTAAHPERGARFTLGHGDWTRDSPAHKRRVFGATWSPDHRAFMRNDMARMPTSVDAIHLDRADILGTPFAEEAFAMLDAVLLFDSRLEDLGT